MLLHTKVALKTNRINQRMGINMTAQSFEEFHLSLVDWALALNPRGRLSCSSIKRVNFWGG